LKDLQHAWAVADKETSKELRQALKLAAEPVRADAQSLAAHTIRRNTPEWERMRVGVTSRSVYVAPKAKGTRQRQLRRPKFANLLASRAMQPALDRNIRQVEAKVDDALATVGRKWENA
jgi:hypothetical protein